MALHDGGTTCAEVAAEHTAPEVVREVLAGVRPPGRRMRPPDRLDRLDR